MDYIVIVYEDGSLAREPLCGDVAPPTFYLPANQNISIVFYTNGDTEMRGWTMSYDTVTGMLLDYFSSCPRALYIVLLQYS